jgi:hypothetical protein
MVHPDAAEIRKMLQVFDQSSSLSPSQAVRMLKSITRNIAKDPEAFDLLADPCTCEGYMQIVLHCSSWVYVAVRSCSVHRQRPVVS